MNTLCWKIRRPQGPGGEIQEAANIIRAGGLVAIPQTVYGLGPTP